MNTTNKVRVCLILFVFVIFIFNIFQENDEPKYGQSSKISAIEPQGGGNPNTVAIFTAKVLQVGFLNDTTNKIHNLAIFLFSSITILGFIFNGYILYQRQVKKNEINISNNEVNLPIEQD